jgi:hypothetical protein
MLPAKIKHLAIEINGQIIKQFHWFVVMTSYEVTMDLSICQGVEY